MRAIAVTALAMCIAAGTWTGPASAYIFDLLDRLPPHAPVAGDCAAIAAKIGPDSTWYGEFAGKRYIEFRDFSYPFSARGCFRTEYECRAWQNVAITYLGSGPLVYTLCRKGIGNRY